MSKRISIAPMHEGQIEIYHQLGRRNVLRCGRRFGKSTMFETMAANWTLRYAWYVGVFAPDYKKLLPIFRNLLVTLKPAIESSSKVEKIITLKNGGQVEFFSLTDEDAGRSRKFHRVLIDEASLVKGDVMKDTWEQAIAPTLLDYAGNAIVAGTPKGTDVNNWFWQICHNQNTPEQWAGFHAPSHANPLLPADELATIEARTHPLVYRQEYLAEFVDFTGTTFFDLAYLTTEGRGVEFPVRCDYVGACIDTAIKDGKEHDGTAVVYFARDQHGIPLTILDWEITQIKGNTLTTWMPTVLHRLEQLAAQCGARYGSGGVFVEDKASGSVLIQEAQDQSWPVQAIQGDLTSKGKNDRALLCSGPVYRNEVRFTQYALDKQMTFKGITANHLITQFCGFVINDPQAYKRADDLADAAMYSILVTLNPSF